MASIFEVLTLGLIQFAVVRQGEVRVIERRGRFVRIAEPGVTWLISLWGYGETIGKFSISRLAREEGGRVKLLARNSVEIIPMRMQVDDYPAESIITRDNATVFIDAVVYYRIIDPQKAVYEVQDYVAALQKLVQAALRDECGQYELDELLTSRDQINTRLRAQLDEATDPWGIKVDRVELKDIDLGDFGRILAEQRAAETKRRTEITEAEGKKRAAILHAEGHNESNVLSAKGEKQATILRAEAEKEASILRAQAAKLAAILHAEAEAESLLKVREAEARGLQMLQKVLQQPQSQETLLRLLEIQKAAEVGEKIANGNATKVFLPAGITNLFGLLDRASTPDS